jgi:hypothetical protein
MGINNFMCSNLAHLFLTAGGAEGERGYIKFKNPCIHKKKGLSQKSFSRKVARKAKNTKCEN